MARPSHPDMNRLPSVHTLMSPPEAKPFDSFNSDRPSLSPHNYTPYDKPESNVLPPLRSDCIVGSGGDNKSSDGGERKRTQSEMDMLSPPVTPHVGNKKRRSSKDERIDRDVETAENRDPVLFPPVETQQESILPNEPLFAPEGAPPAVEELVDRHITEHAARFKRSKTKIPTPTRGEYLLAISCVPVVATRYNSNPAAWAEKERDILDTYFTNIFPVRHKVQPQPRKIAPAPAKGSASPSKKVSDNGVKKPRQRRTPRNTPKSKAADLFDSPADETPKPRAIGINRDDTDYTSIPDYCPPISTLNGNTSGLRAEWKGSLLDHKKKLDPDIDALDPAELYLASVLRLSCATYLCSKRRIFQAKLAALRIGKEFRKTDAQQACKIDVNKASKLWTAYDRVGWFDRKYFEKWL